MAPRGSAVAHRRARVGTQRARASCGCRSHQARPRPAPEKVKSVKKPGSARPKPPARTLLSPRFPVPLAPRGRGGSAEGAAGPSGCSCGGGGGGGAREGASAGRRRRVAGTMEGQSGRCKIVVVGDAECGKTALLQVFAKDAYPGVRDGVWGAGG